MRCRGEVRRGRVALGSLQPGDEGGSGAKPGRGLEDEDEERTIVAEEWEALGLEE